MMEQEYRPLGQTQRWLLIVGLIAVSATLGYGAAHWLAGRSATVSGTSAKAEAAASATSAPSAASTDKEPPDIKIPAEYLAIAKVAVEPVLGGGLEAEILSAGTVTAPPNSEAIIVAKASGNISRIHRQLGDAVHAGEALAQIDSQEASTMMADKNVANAKLALARQTYTREASLFEQGVSARQEMEAAQSALAVAEAEAKRALTILQAAHVTEDGKSAMIISPIAGKITAQMAILGSFAQPQTELFRVSAAAAVQIETAVQAADVARISVGDKASIIPANGMPVSATVRSLTPSVSGSAHTATVILTPVTTVTKAAASARSGLLVGEGVQVRLHVKGGTSRMVVPEDAVQNIDGHDALFVRTKDGFRIQAVLVGERSAGMAQIISGIQIGELVATKNAFLIKADMIKTAKDE